MLPHRDRPSQNLSPSSRRCLVICVDDEPSILRALQRVLGNEPYDLLTLGDPEKVLFWMEKHPADVVLADEKMPGMRGTKLLEEVSRRSSQTACALLTAYPEPSLVARETAFPIRRLISKPWQDNLLRGDIQWLLRERGNPDGMRFVRDQLLRCAPNRKPGGPVGPVEVRIDLQASTSASVLEQLVPICIWAHHSKDRPVVILENLDRFTDSLSRLLKDLTRVVERIDARLDLQDSSGAVAAFLEASREGWRKHE